MPRKPITNVTIKNYNYYRITASIGKKSDGTPIRKQFYGKSKKEALQKRDCYCLNIRQGIQPGFDQYIFGPLFQEWYDHVLIPGLALSTIKRYDQEIRLRLKVSSLMSMPLIEIKPLHIQKLYSALIAKGTSPNSIRIIHNVLSGFFSYCLKIDMLIKTPLSAVKLPKDRSVKNKKNGLTNTEIQQIVSHAQKNPEAFIFVFAIFTGLRQGEILALSHKDIKNGLINVNKTVCYLSINGLYQPILSPAKTTRSIRQVPIFEKLVPMLQAHIEAEKEKHHKRGVLFSGDSVLFSSPSCGYYNGRYLRRKLCSLYERLNIDPTTFHGLRHTFCTALAQNGVSIKAASQLMGHSNINTTVKIYTHVQEEEKYQGIASLVSVFP